MMKYGPVYTTYQPECMAYMTFLRRQKVELQDGSDFFYNLLFLL